MKTLTISINEDLLSRMDQEMKANHYANRSEFIRMLIRNYFTTAKDMSLDIEPIHAGDPDAQYLQQAGKGTYISLDKLPSPKK